MSSQGLLHDTHMSQDDLRRAVLVRYLGGLVALCLFFFVPAGSIAYWQAWLYLAVLFIPMAAVLVYLLRHDPALLERRMRVREREQQQRRIIGLSLVWYVLVYLIPSLDFRFSWSAVPVWLVLLSNLLVLLSYGFFFLVMKENSYASRVIEVSAGQSVIDTGPYAVVRHPMYLAVGLLFLVSPLALGSYWAVLPGLMIVAILVARIRNEEAVLLRDLPGYPAYMQKVRYRLLPGVW
jgi:protein-S-isoprenylcysteine O-methyltransferase Ste14